jgi:hypothetical protein
MTAGADREYSRILPRFRKTYIEITNVCNRSCNFCPGTTRPPRFMDRDLFERILDQLRGFASLLHFHVMGEPLLHPEIGGFLDSCASRGYRVNVVTNGALLPGAGEALLGKSAMRQVSISLHHLSERASPAALDDYFQGIGDFIRKAGVYPGLFISLRLWNKRSRLDAAFWDDITRRIAALFSLPFSSVALCDEKNPLKLAENIWLNCAERFEWPGPDKPDLGNQGSCLGLREQIAFLADGTVIPCCLDHNGAMALGAVTSTALSDILSSPRAMAMRDGFCKGVITEDLCRKCSYRLRFGR